MSRSGYAALLLGVLVVGGSLALGVAGRSGGSDAPSAPLAPVPSAGFTVSANGLSPAAASLAWTASTATGFDNYTVRVSNASASGPWTLAAVVTAESSPAAVVSNLEPDGTYWWNVTAYSTTAGILGIGAKTVATYGEVISTLQPGVAYLTSPSNSSDSINLSWTNNATYTPGGSGGITFGAYTVEEVDDGSLSVYATITNPSDRLLDVTNLLSGHSYSFFVNTSDACSGCSPGGRSTTSSNTITAGTATALTATATETRAVVDTGLLVGFTCNPSGGTAPYTFRWNYTNGTTSFVAGSGTSSHVYAEPSTSGYTVRCQVTDHAGDRFVTPAVDVLVNPPPKVVASVGATNVTVGSSLAFRCAGSLGTAPTTAAWTLGDGARLGGSDGYANGSASYGSTGTYVAQCVVTDALGVRATASYAIEVHPKPAFSWVTPELGLLAGLASGVVLAIGVAAARRRDEEAERRTAMSRWVPPTGPASSVRGAKVCPKCGSTNLPIRRTCQACGAPLPRNPEP